MWLNLHPTINALLLQLQKKQHFAIASFAAVDLQEGDILFTEEFVKPICTAMRVSFKPKFSPSLRILAVLHHCTSWCIVTASR